MAVALRCWPPWSGRPSPACRCCSPQPTYYGEFTDAGALPGDKVRIAGIDVGSVQDAGDRRRQGGRPLHHRRQLIGTKSRLPSAPTPSWVARSWRSSRGGAPRCARRRAAAGPDQHAVPDLRRVPRRHQSRARWDIDTVKQSLNVLSETVDQTYPHLSAALDGVAAVLRHHRQARRADPASAGQREQDRRVLGNRSEQINRLLVNAQALLAAINERGQAVDAAAAATCRRSPPQMQGLIDDNPNLNHVLEQVRAISDVLVDSEGRPRRPR